MELQWQQFNKNVAKEKIYKNKGKQKQQTNTRSAGKDHTVVLKRPRKLSLEVCLDYINSDELVEVTPENFRMRKKILNTEERKKFDARKNSQFLRTNYFFMLI